MSLNRNEKAAVVTDVSAQAARSQTLALAEYRGLTVESLNNDKMVIKGGAYAGKALDANGIKTLAAVPSKEVLLAQLLGLMQSPISRLARVVAAIAEKKAGPAVAEAEAPAAA